MGSGGTVRVLCYDILKQNNRPAIIERMILMIALVWPQVLCKGTHILTDKLDAAVTICGPPYYPFLATLHVTLFSRDLPRDQTRQLLQELLGWCAIPENHGAMDWLARELVRILVVRGRESLRKIQVGINVIGKAYLESCCFKVILLTYLGVR